MTEAEWRCCADPVPMLDFIQPRASDRKLRLFAVACARLRWERLPPGEMREAVEVAERFADGLATDGERQWLSNRMWSIPVEHGRATGGNWFLARPPEDVSAYMAAMLSVGRLTCGRITARPTWEAGARTTGPRQPELLRCVFGNPFRPAAIEPAWRTAQVAAIARQAYESRDFGALPALADALQRAGCDDAVVLTHCRDAEQIHARGCWVIDLILSGEPPVIEDACERRRARPDSGRSGGDP